MRTRLTIALASLAIGLSLPFVALADTSVTAGAAGIYPSDTSFNGVPISGVEFGFGVIVGTPTIGQFCVVLVGIEAGGIQQRIKIQGEASGGQQTSANAAVFSGSSSIDMGDGTAPISGVPFTATVTTDGNDQGTLGLVIGDSTLPNASVSQGSMTIK
jgi:hypothetical protein